MDVVIDADSAGKPEGTFLSAPWASRFGASVLPVDHLSLEPVNCLHTAHDAVHMLRHCLTVGCDFSFCFSVNLRAIKEWLFVANLGARQAQCDAML